jgi:hypothetical protein
VFYDCLQKLLGEAGFDAFVEETCKPLYAPRMGALSLPPGAEASLDELTNPVKLKSLVAEPIIV